MFRGLGFRGLGFGVSQNQGYHNTEIGAVHAKWLCEARLRTNYASKFGSDLLTSCFIQDSLSVDQRLQMRPMRLFKECMGGG